MAGTEMDVRDRLSVGEASLAVRHGRVIPLFQPIEALQTGECRGFEALARLSHKGELVAPGTFLNKLNVDDRLCLFGVMLGESIALLKRSDALSSFYVSINVEISLIVGDDFVDILRYFLERHDFSGERLVLEILENEDVTDFSRLHRNLDAIRRLGLSIALDDIGSAYASLTKIRDLPIDIFKLDRSFSRDLEMHPEDLIFVLSILSLARGLDKRLIVEGIETPETYDALRILGVDLGQGYGIAAPMPASEVESWLATRRAHAPDQRPRSLLGTYASVLAVVETCRCLKRQPLPIAWSPVAKDHLKCVVGQLFTERGWHDTAFGAAHRAFHEVLPLYAHEDQRWAEATQHFMTTMAEAIAARPQAFRCDPAETATRPTKAARSGKQPGDPARTKPTSAIAAQTKRRAIR